MHFDGNIKPIGPGSLVVTEEAEDLFKNAKIEGDVGWRVKVGEDIVTDKEWVQGDESEWGLSANVKGKYVLLTFEAMYETADELEENYWTTHVFKNRELVLVPVDDTPIDIDGAEMTIAADEVLINPNGFNTDNDYGLTAWSESFFRLSIEPVEVNVTDAFRAAVAKVAPKAAASGGGSSGGGTGGGVLVVHDMNDTLDKTWQEIHDSAPLVWLTDGDGGYVILGAVFEDDGEFCVTFDESQPDGHIMRSYFATSASGYPASNAS